MRERSCGAVIFIRDATNEPIYLLLHYESRHWDFVKGHQERGETEEETLRREAAEETGLVDLTMIDGFRTEITYLYRRDKELMQKTVVFFLAQTHTRTITLSHEHIGYIWLPYEQALKKMTFKNAKNVLTQAHTYLTHAPSR